PASATLAVVGGGMASPPWNGWGMSTPGSPRARARRSREEWVRRRRGAAERGEVDSRERALRREGRDRLGQAADDATADLRGRERARLPARPRRPAGLPAAARRAH